MREYEAKKARKAKEIKPIKEEKKLTLMFFFASDNNLSPSMLYQLKAIKSAGFQRDTNVVVYFDPHEKGVPSMIFDINRNEKDGVESSRIGDGEDPIILNLAGDQVEPDTTKPNSQSSADYDERKAHKALNYFLKFCRKNYPAKHYMLFLIGHGLVVGSDAFLPDDNPASGISLVKLGSILERFNQKIKPNGGVLELIGMHSCSMSAVEVAYQLKGKAKYMIGSEGLSFIGAWPYRQMLQKIYSTVDREINVNAADLVKKLYELCVHNSADFIFAGYSSDLCLCSLDQRRVNDLTEPIQVLSKTLRDAVKDERCKELIQLAHLKSQSYFQELYTDLYDFCRYLSRSCKDAGNLAQQNIVEACRSVIDVLKPGEGTRGPIIQADFFGPDYQYSYGLSIYFPWTKPIESANEHVIENYKTYAFVTQAMGDSWLEFLSAYLEETKRDDPRDIEYSPYPDYNRDLALELARSTFKSIGFGSGTNAYASGMLTGKVNPSDAGGYWIPSTIKNYPREFLISELALRVFDTERWHEKTRMDHCAYALQKKISLIGP